MSVATEDKMDPNNSYLGRTLLQEITPVVMVLSTPLVEQACSNNSLNFVQMLLPFSVFNNIDVPVRTAGDQPYRLQTFKLRLVYASDIRQQNVEAAEEHLKQVFSHAGEEVLCDLQQDPPELETVLTMAESNSLSSLFQIFNKEFIRTLSFSDHETFDHPVACLLVVSSKDDQPVNKFVDLFNTGQFPSLLNEGAMDPKILKYFLLVHDNLDGPSEKALDVLTEMRSTFGPNYCRLLCINSAQDGDEEHTDNPWASYKINDSPSSDVGRFLNINDLYEIKDLMQALSSKHTIPHMEQKIRALNQQVSATRKGFRNQIKNLWWRKGREDTFDMPNGPMYTFSSIESQIRVLGDYAFMLRDYELALSNYRLLSTDYKLDKAWKHYAGVQEMMGLSLFMLDQSRKDAEYCMETAFSTYLKIGSSGQRNATRCGLWWAEMLKARGQYKEAAVVYFRISNEEPSLHAAAMLEQASYCYLYSNPPMLRKYGFHLVLAGNRYSICDQRKHAIRSYRSALPVYKGYEWNYISDHVHFNIGRWFAFFGVFDVAIRHMLEVLACSHQSLATQQLFFGDFLHIVQNTGKKFYVFRLQLPIINMASLKVLYEDHRTYASPDAARVKETSWQSLEEEMVPSIPSVRANWLDSLPKSLFVKKNEESNVCVAGEAIKVDLEFKNPLQMSLSVHGASLVCKLFASSAVMGSDNPSVSDDDKMRVATGLYDDAEVNKFIREPDGDGATSFMSSKVDFTLEGGETKMVQLNVIPKMEGVLQIIGVRWTLSGFVVGYHDFDSNLSKKKHIRGRRNIASKNASICTLKFVVIKSLPRLEGFIHHLPQKTYAGDLRRLVLELRNHSESSVKNLKLRINHPRFLIPGKLKDLDLDFPICLEEQTSCQSSSIQDNAVEKSIGFVFSFPKESTVQDGMTFLWPLWLHTGVYGSISLNMSIYYEMENVSGDMSYRTLRMHYDLEVLPSLDISVHITPSPSRLEEYLVRMDVTNKSHSESFLLRQVSSIGNEWKISSLLPYILAEAQDGFSPQSDDATPRASCPSTAICPCQVLPAGQALSCFFKIMGSRKSSAMNGTTPSDRSVQKSDARLAPRSHDEALVDVSCSPLSEFHLHERTHQDKSIEEFRSAVDFILISQPQEDIASITPRGLSESPLLCSHYVCYCSISSISPIQWLMEGPHTVNHDFSISFCKIGFQMTIHNCSNAAAFIRISTFDVMTNTGWQSSDTARPSLSSSGGQVVGWHDLPFANSGSPSSVDGIISPFVWCASSSTQVRLESMSLAEVPLEICVFSPGTYDLSNYVLHWNLELSDDGEGKSSGMSPGHPFYLTILQSP